MKSESLLVLLISFLFSIGFIHLIPYDFQININIYRFSVIILLIFIFVIILAF